LNLQENELTEQELYPVLLNKILKYIIKVKEFDKETSMLDLILEYSMRNSLDIELVGDAISTDDYFKNILQKDLEINNYGTEKKVNYDW
jgi:hypothetical protein